MLRKPRNLIQIEKELRNPLINQGIDPITKEKFVDWTEKQVEVAREFGVPRRIFSLYPFYMVKNFASSFFSDFYENRSADFVRDLDIYIQDLINTYDLYLNTLKKIDENSNVFFSDGVFASKSDDGDFKCDFEEYASDLEILQSHSGSLVDESCFEDTDKNNNLDCSDHMFVFDNVFEVDNALSEEEFPIESVVNVEEKKDVHIEYDTDSTESKEDCVLSVIPPPLVLLNIPLNKASYNVLSSSCDSVNSGCDEIVSSCYKLSGVVGWNDKLYSGTIAQPELVTDGYIGELFDCLGTYLRKETFYVRHVIGLGVYSLKDYLSRNVDMTNDDYVLIKNLYERVPYDQIWECFKNHPCYSDKFIFFLKRYFAYVIGSYIKNKYSVLDGDYKIWFRRRFDINVLDHVLADDLKKFMSWYEASSQVIYLLRNGILELEDNDLYLLNESLYTMLSRIQDLLCDVERRKAQLDSSQVDEYIIGFMSLELEDLQQKIVLEFPCIRDVIYLCFKYKLYERMYKNIKYYFDYGDLDFIL